MSNFPTDIANQALDAAGIDYTLGDIEEGTREAQVILRAYSQCRKQLIRAVHWDCFRKQAPLTLLGDATGNTPDVGTAVPRPWVFCYAYPTDCMKIRLIPWNNCSADDSVSSNITLPPGVPQTTGQPTTNQFGRLIPSRFVIDSDPNYPPQDGQQIWEVQGVSPIGRTVILSNVRNAEAVYTYDNPYPSVWDPQFRAALVAYLASEIAFSLHKDKKLGLEVRRMQIAIAKERIMQARITDGNEGFYSSDISVDWLRARNTGGGNQWQWGSGDGPGVLGYGWDSCMFGDGTAF